ncbi:hypothetical protein NDU88_009059 [Pleurodeles waltl]|uniref:Uncharacterized protein n=1 Tax=Pleurodeles waltl TaxID=8319 RepID=A0AAV7NY50_PLEWA|nr:hypothetical protein NDU88_009059 [Pleurodeles waltl]
MGAKGLKRHHNACYKWKKKGASAAAILGQVNLFPETQSGVLQPMEVPSPDSWLCVGWGGWVCVGKRWVDYFCNENKGSGIFSRSTLDFLKSWVTVACFQELGTGLYGTEALITLAPSVSMSQRRAWQLRLGMHPNRMMTADLGRGSCRNKRGGDLRNEM